MASPAASGTLSAAQETALVQSICHFFSWRSAQEAKEKEGDNDKSSPSDQTNAAKTTASAGESPPEQGADPKQGSAEVETTATPDSGRYKRALDFLVKEFPNVGPIHPQMGTVAPIISTAFFACKAFHRQNQALQLRNQDLENRLKRLESSGSTATQAKTTTPAKPKEPARKASTQEVKMDEEAIAYYAALTDGAQSKSSSGKATKRKATNTALADLKNHSGAFTAADDSSPSKKKARAAAPLSLNARISHRKDVPDDVKQLIKGIRNQARNQRDNTKRQISRLEGRVEKQKEELITIKYKAPAPVAAAAAPLPAPRKRAPEEPLMTFDNRMKELEHFHKGYGHCRVPTKTSGLGYWVRDLRRNYKWFDPTLEPPPVMGPTYLTQERVDRLNALGFQWVVCKAPAQVLKWDERYQQLVEYKEKHGDTRVPRSYKDPNVTGLGDWVHTQRKEFRANRMKPENKAKLDAIGFVYYCTHFTNSTWEKRIEECRQHRWKHGHLKVAAIPEDAEVTLAERSFSDWACRMRKEHFKFKDGRQSYLDRKKINQLNELDFDFTLENPVKKRKQQEKGTRSRATYEEQLEKLRVVKERYGDCSHKTNIDKTFPEDKSLYLWCRNQRKEYKQVKLGKKSCMTPERVRQLLELGFNFEPRKNHAPNGSLKAKKRATETSAQGRQRAAGASVQQQRAPVAAAARHPNRGADEDEDDSDDQGYPQPEESVYRDGVHHGHAYTDHQRAVHWLAAGRARYSTGHC